MALLQRTELSIAGSSDVFQLEHRVFNLSSFIIMVFCLQGMMINYAIGLNMATVWLALIGFIVSVTLFYLSRVRYWFTPATVFIYTIATMILLGGMFFYNGGSDGPIIYLINMLLNIYLLITRKVHQTIIYALLTATVLLLLLIEYYRPDTVIPYKSTVERTLDYTSSLMYSMFFTMLVIRSFKSSYDKDKVLITAQKNALEEAYDATTKKNEYIESLIREIHHRVKNNLQVISSLMLLQSYRVDDPRAREALDEGRNRVSAIAMVHQKLYMDNELAKVNISEYLQSLSETIAQSIGHPNENIQVKVLPANRVVDIDMAIPVGLIVNELVTNCFKHAFTQVRRPQVWVSLIQGEDKKITLTVGDNGKGMDRGQADSSTSFGMKLVNILVKQLKGSISFIHENGTIVLIEFTEEK